MRPSSGIGIEARHALATLGLVLLVGRAAAAAPAPEATPPRYADALRMAIVFYDANRCGKDVAEENAFAWRQPCHTDDGADVGVDLSGGFHDAGDHVKFGLTQGYAASVLGWTYYEYRDVLRRTGNDEKLLSTLRRFADYFMKAHPRPDVFYYQIGDGGEDHAYWGAPEKQPGPRPTRRWADAQHPASDVLGETAAALALASVNFREADPSYAKRCLESARELYEMGKKTPGLGDHKPFYPSSSYLDDLSWAAVWLHVATGDGAYLKDVRAFLDQALKNKQDPFHSRSTMSWDDVTLPVLLKMADLTGEKRYREGIARNLRYWMKSLKTTPGGLKYFAQWGALRYAASESMLALLYSRKAPGARQRAFARSQIDYILGHNPAKMSYLIGFGSSFPQDPHHRASVSCRYEKGRKDSDCVLTGALVGGPNDVDEYQDSMDMYQYSEVAIDYNAGLIGALAALAE